MPAAAFLFAATNHPGAITGPGVVTVLINEMAAVCVGDTHVCAMPPVAGPHPSNPIAKGSKTVLIGGRPAARMGDLCGCGAVILGGSLNVDIGG
jgi:uncharacterized Zn-binding protein involved in type VI secretion